MKKHLLLAVSIILFLGFPFSTSIFAQNSNENVKIAKFKNWQNTDLKKDKKNGVSTQKAYNELLKGKTSSEIVVAVIDGGIDIYHEDLKEVIWTNSKEISGNGVDDDKNGYIDDIHGWNFIGGAKGNIIFESLECTREYNRLRNKYDGKKFKDVNISDTVEFRYYKRVEAVYKKERTEADEYYEMYNNVKNRFDKASKIVKNYSKITSINLKDLKNITVIDNIEVQDSKEYLIKLFELGLDSNTIAETFKHFETKYKYHTNVDCNVRSIVGDDPYNFNDSIYGNNDVKGENSTHGTMVSGLIAAKRNNNIGIDGIADNIKIMCIRVVPDGDERDKDVALAIRYAVNNGAKIINMSFGKEFSLQSKLVLEAIEYAADNNVLLIHASGNDASDIDIVSNFPSSLMVNSSRANDSYIEVGSNTIYKNKNMVASFSNYGATTVDILAPGKDIYSTIPENKYDFADGTSLSCPIVSGIAALVWSYNPRLTAKQVKEIIMKSGTSFTNKKVLCPYNSEGKKPKVKFATICVTGMIANVYNALILAEQYK